MLLNFCVSRGEGRYSKLRLNFSLYSFCVALESVVNLSGQFKTCDSAIYATEDTDFECNESTCSLKTPWTERTFFLPFAYFIAYADGMLKP